MSNHDTTPPSFRFPPKARLRRGGDFERVYAKRCTMRNDALRLFATSGTGGRPRLGLSVSRKVGNAVVRNRWKRAIREAFRLRQQQLPEIDLIVQPLLVEPPAVDALGAELVRLAKKLAARLSAPDDASPAEAKPGRKGRSTGKPASADKPSPFPPNSALPQQPPSQQSPTSQ